MFWKPLLIGLCALLFSGAATPAFVGPTTLEPSTVELLFSTQIYAWKLACEAKKVNCEAISPPLVGYAILWGQYGRYYIGADEILVDIRLIGQPLSVLIIMHEMIHYIQNVQGHDLKGGPSAAPRCDDEQEAFTLVRKTNDELKIYVGPDIEKYVQTWEHAKENYPACMMLGIRPPFTGA